MTRRGRRLALIAAALAVVGGAAGIALYALSDSIVFFYSPTEVAEKAFSRARGCASAGSSSPARWSSPPGEKVAFVVTDGANISGSPTRACCRTCSARARAWSPRACWRPPGQLRAETILAKHDERYMPREVVEALKKQGRWQEGEDVAKP